MYGHDGDESGSPPMVADGDYGVRCNGGSQGKGIYGGYGGGGGGYGSRGCGGGDYGGNRDMAYVNLSVEGGGREYEGDRGSGSSREGNSPCTNPRVSSRRQTVNKVCAVINMGFEYGVFILNLDDDRVPGEKGVEFVKKVPNLIILGSHSHYCFCGLNGNLYMIEGLSGLKLKNFDFEKVQIYKIKILPEYSSAKKLVLNRDKVNSDKIQNVSQMKIPKIMPAAVRCEYGLLIFSTKIAYWTEAYDGYFGDFELFNSDTLQTELLPPLCIRRSVTVNDGCQYSLLNADSDLPSDLPIRSRYSRSNPWNESSPSFKIIAFSMIDPSNLVVQTDFGGMLHLHLHRHSWQVFEGTNLPDYGENIVTKDSEFMLCASGASRFSTSDGSGDNGCQRCFTLGLHIQPYSLPSHSAIALSENTEHPYYFPFILRVEYDEMELAYWTLDVVELDASEFEFAFEEKLKKLKIGLRIKSFKFWSGNHGYDFIPKCLYPF